MKSLFDPASGVRSKTTKGIQILGKHFGQEWILTIIPKLKHAWESTDVN